MARKDVLKRSMFQMGGEAIGAPPPMAPPPMGGGIVEGLGLDIPDAMPTAAPPTPSPAEQQTITGGIESLTGMLDQIEGAGDTQSLINAMRGDEKTVDERYTELAKYVGRKDATATPESVLTLVQPTFELLDQAEGGGGGLGLGVPSDILGPSAPPPVEETMSLTETETITEPVQGFQWGGFAAKKSNTPVYRQDGSPYTGEVAPFVMQGVPNPYVETPDALSRAQEFQQQYPLTSKYNLLGAEQDALHEYNLPSNIAARQIAGTDSYQDIVFEGSSLANVPEHLTQVGLKDTIAEGLVAPQDAKMLMGTSMELAEDEGLFATDTTTDIQNRLNALLGPSKEVEKTPEQLLKERQDFIGLPEDKGAAAFALAEAFGTLATTPGPILQGMAAMGKELAPKLAEIGREKSVLEYQAKNLAFDEYKALKERIRLDDRGIAEKAFDMSQSNIEGNRSFKQNLLANALQEAAMQSRTHQELMTHIRELSITLGMDWSTETMKVLAKTYEPMLTPEYDKAGREFRWIPDVEMGGLKKIYSGFMGEDGAVIRAGPNRITAADPSYVAPAEGATAVADVGTWPEASLNNLRTRLFERDQAIAEGNSIMRDMAKLPTGPGSTLKSFSTNTLGAFGVDEYATFIGNSANKARVREWIRMYIAAEALSDRYAMGEQKLIGEIPDIDQEFFNDPEAGFARLKTLVTGMINTNEFDHALLEGRPPGRIEYQASATRNDPMDWDRPSVRDTIGLMEEQGRTWSGWIEMTPDQATVQNPRINPNGLQRMEEVAAVFDPESVLGKEIRSREGFIKPTLDISLYEGFREKGNNVYTQLKLRPPAKEGDYSRIEFTDMASSLATPLDVELAWDNQRRYILGGLFPISF